MQAWVLQQLLFPVAGQGQRDPLHASEPEAAQALVTGCAQCLLQAGKPATFLAAHARRDRIAPAPGTTPFSKPYTIQSALAPCHSPITTMVKIRLKATRAEPRCEPPIGK